MVFLLEVQELYNPTFIKCELWGIFKRINNKKYPNEKKTKKGEHSLLKSVLGPFSS